MAAISHQLRKQHEKVKIIPLLCVNYSSKGALTLNSERSYKNILGQTYQNCLILRQCKFRLDSLRIWQIYHSGSCGMINLVHLQTLQSNFIPPQLAQFTPIISPKCWHIFLAHDVNLKPCPFPVCHTPSPSQVQMCLKRIINVMQGMDARFCHKLLHNSGAIAIVNVPHCGAIAIVNVPHCVIVLKLERKY